MVECRVRMMILALVLVLIMVVVVVMVRMARAVGCMRQPMSTRSEMLLLRQVRGRVEDAQSHREQDQQENEGSRLLLRLVRRMVHRLRVSRPAVRYCAAPPDGNLPFSAFVPAKPGIAEGGTREVPERGLPPDAAETDGGAALHQAVVAASDDALVSAGSPH
jgi:hypothetical protein